MKHTLFIPLMLCCLFCSGQSVTDSCPCYISKDGYITSLKSPDLGIKTPILSQNDTVKLPLHVVNTYDGSKDSVHIEDGWELVKKKPKPVEVFQYPEFGFIYCKGIGWTENKNQDSILSISIDGDTMTAVRSLLVYCTQEKNENDAAYRLLATVNLDQLSKIMESKEFDFYLKDYRKIVKKNKKQRIRDYPKIGIHY